ncbi:MAG TPA: DNA polymerase III subunit delta [Pyrinomonadaceae bacterium]|nr:DNA polymerase III subunit delta [Pyrinomonadaceae bacterium]
MNLTREQLWKNLKQGEIAPVYLLFGNEPFLRDRAAATIATHALGESAVREFNETTVSLTNSDGLASALASAMQLPMMAERRVVRITDVRVSATGTRDTLKEDHEAMLVKYLERPSESTVLIFVADEIDKRRRMTKLLLDRAASIEFSRLDDADLANWARREITNDGFDIDERTLAYFVSLVGDDLQRLTTEIKKITTAALPDRIITTDLVESLVPSSRILSNFDLADHLFAADKSRTFETLKKILDDGAEPLMLLGLIATNFRRLLKAKALMESGADRRDVARTLGLPYRKQEEFLALARRTDARRLMDALGRIAKTDVAIKTSRGGGGPNGARLQIELLVAELVRV